MPAPGDGAPSDLPRLRADLAHAAQIADQTERLLEVTAIIGEALADLGIQPVVVGGLAVAHWSDRQFVTGDIDAVMPRRAEFGERTSTSAGRTR